MHRIVWSANLQTGGHLEDQGVGEKMILKWFLKMQGAKWLRIASSVRLV
jgi:hypothetical protein